MTASASGGPPIPGAAATKMADEFAAVVRPLRRLWETRAAELVLALAVLLTALVAFAVAGAVLDDHAIDADRGVAQAEVLEGSTFLRTLVRFTTSDGETVVPADGVAYPRDLQIGLTVPVEYAVSEPERVRVAGRTALGQSGTLGVAVLVTWVVLGPTAFWSWRRRRRAS